MITYTLALILFAAPAEQWPVLWPTVPPVIQSSASPFAELQASSIEKEYAAPIPDSLVGYDVHEVTDAAGNPGRIVLEQPVADEVLTRIDGPTWSWPHAGCEMCVGNALISKGFDEQYLRGLTYKQWGVLWDNVHNNPDLAKGKPPGEGYIGYEAGGGYSSRRGLLGRIFRRSKQ